MPRPLGSWEWVNLPVHMTDIWVAVNGFPRKLRLSIYLFSGKFYVCEPKMGYVIPMYKGPLSVSESDSKTISKRTVEVLRERAKMGLEIKIAERGLDKVVLALKHPSPQLQFLEV